jgi:hypothetical protein
MKRIVGVAILLATMLLPSVAAAQNEHPESQVSSAGNAGTTKARQEQQYAQATFIQDLPCTHLEGFAVVADTTLRPGTIRVFEVQQIRVQKFDTCDQSDPTGVKQVIDARGDGVISALVIDFDNETASAAAELDAFDLIGRTSLTLNLNLVWSVQHPINGIFSFDHVDRSDFLVSETDVKSHGNSKSAIVSGSINDGINEYASPLGLGVIGTQSIKTIVRPH